MNEYLLFYQALCKMYDVDYPVTQKPYKAGTITILILQINRWSYTAIGGKTYLTTYAQRTALLQHSYSQSLCPSQHYKVSVIRFFFLIWQMKKLSIKKLVDLPKAMLSTS